MYIKNALRHLVYLALISTIVRYIDLIILRYIDLTSFLKKDQKIIFLRPKEGLITFIINFFLKIYREKYKKNKL